MCHSIVDRWAYHEENVLEFKELDPNKKVIVDFRHAFVNLSLMWRNMASTALADQHEGYPRSSNVQIHAF